VPGGCAARPCTPFSVSAHSSHDAGQVRPLRGGRGARSQSASRARTFRRGGANPILRRKEGRQAPFSLGRAFGQLTAASENFLGQLDRAIGLSDGLARALSAAAHAVDGVRQGAGLLIEGGRLADLRRQADALAAQICTLAAGVDTTRNRCTLRPRLTNEDRLRRLEEVQRQYFAVFAQIDTAKRATLVQREAERAMEDLGRHRLPRQAGIVDSLTAAAMAWPSSMAVNGFSSIGNSLVSQLSWPA
jgi:hypothetical protein